MSKYVAKQPDEHGIVHYTDEENGVWAELFERQEKIIVNRACDEFIDGIEILGMPRDRVPQIPEINAVLANATGWGVDSVPALIPSDQFFGLLANKHFPAATFMRLREEIDYLEEPDLFHEYFGHCPLITNQAYADFMEDYGKLALKVSDLEREYLARLYWFTIEFGLVQTNNGVRVYGGGILSSINETVYALESDAAERKPFNILDALRTPYRIDIMQPAYYVINSFEQLHEIMQADLLDLIKQAQALGDFAPKFDTKGAPDTMSFFAC